jgi:Predicted acetyltransferases and hydrolases with the alpha/beta hydrolase fold
LAALSVGISPKRSVDERGWYDYLIKNGFTVAAWTQPGLTFSDAAPSALTAIDHFAADTKLQFPDAPPPIALIGHSRGGLLIRDLLKKKGNLGRVRWAITLNSPHRGSHLATLPRPLGDYVLIDELPSYLKIPARRLIRPALSWLDRFGTQPEDRELAPTSSLLQNLADKEEPITDISYYTFGGTNPDIFKVYYYSFGWPRELPLVSPLLRALNLPFPETRNGQGDGLVSDESSRLPSSFHAVHITKAVNHAEVLWDWEIQRHVCNSLSRDRRVIVTIRSIRLTDPARLGQKANVVFTINVGGGTVTTDVLRRIPEDGTIEYSLGQSLDLQDIRFSREPGCDLLSVAVSVNEPERIISDVIPADESRTRRPIFREMPFHMGLFKTYSRNVNYGEGTRTERLEHLTGAILEVTFTIQVFAITL